MGPHADERGEKPECAHPPGDEVQAEKRMRRPIGKTGERTLPRRLDGPGGD
jgi:hypothetical protein